MTQSESESFLKALAERTFLKLWAIPNAFYAPGKELTDLIVPFGDDVIIFSDKASRFDFTIDHDLAWSRWYSRAIEDSVRQLRTAMQRVERSPSGIFTDPKARESLPFELRSGGTKRFHLVAIARPARDPMVSPPQWPGLVYVRSSVTTPFRIGPVEAAGKPVHIFDGPTINLLLHTLDTAQDFIAYLKGRSRRMLEASAYEFSEPDLLAAALIDWDTETGILPAPPPLATIVPGIWKQYSSSEVAEQRREANVPSRIIDAFIEQQHREYVGERFLYERPSFEQHEYAMRLLAAESRFARRMIAHELHDILNESDQSTFWASTVRSPTMPSLRYVWLTYPQRPNGIDDLDADHFLLNHLKKHVLVAQGLFNETLVLGIALPNREANDTANYTVLHDGSNWTDNDRTMALSLQREGIFDRIEAQHRVHVP